MLDSPQDSSPQSEQEERRHLSPEQQERILRDALETVPSSQASLQMRQLLSLEGVGLVLLGQLLRAKDMVTQKVMVADLANEEGRMIALRNQGIAKGFELAIDIVFEIVNFEEESNG